MIHTYREFMEMCFRNDYSAILPRFVDEKIAGFGTALDEKIQGIAGIKKLLKIQKRQSKGLEISWKIKPVSHYTSEDGNTAVFADDVYLTIKAGKEIIEMYVRISVILNYHNNLWKVIHWHCSKPEQVESEKDTWGVVSWKQRAQELERLVAEKTADLIKKNRELAIEAAMEKVRARSLAMQKPEELVEVAEVLRNEMGKLGVEELETSSIYIVDEKKATTACWYAIKDVRGQNKRLVTDYMTLVLEETWVGREMQKFYRSKKTRTSILMHGKNRKEWINHCADKSSVLQGYYGGEIPDRTYHLLKFSNGFMGEASPGEISPESWDLLQRATAVFSFAYKRFSDLQKAEAQAKEAQIQLALERVRARTMAMQKSEELPEAAALLFQQVQSLGMPAWSAGYCLWNDDDKKSVTLWMSSEGVIQPPFTAPTTKDALFIQMRKGAEEGKTFHVVEMGGKQLVKHYQYMRTLPVVGKILDSIIAAGHPLPTFQIMHQVYFSKGFLLFITYQPVPDVHEIFKRFAKVFDQTYIRFLDLQKAEAQAREAQIEAALERVRSRSLAMHNSNELSELVATLFDELIKLDLVLARCIIWILNQDKSAQLWMANSESKQLANNYHITRIDHSYYNAIVKGWQDRNEHWVYELKGAEKKSIDKILLFETELRQLPEEVKQGILNTTQTYVAGAFNKFGLIEASGPVRHTEEQLQILHRFNKVFEQCYTRFLDLQKAEAQAREAQIEAALERVRAKTMAMHRSEDLLSTVSLLFDQFRLLQKGNISEDIDRSALALVNEKEKRFDLWITQEGGTESNQKYQIDFSEETHGIALCQSFKQKDSHIVIDNTGVKLSQWLDYLKSTGMKISSGLYRKRRINTSIRFSNGFIIITSEEPLTDQNILLLNRFTKVFEQTYTRFLDLQKAEDQAKEAQIEAALERVRSRSLAMHQPNELKEVVTVLFERLKELNVELDTANINIWNSGSKDVEVWSAAIRDNTIRAAQYHSPYFDHPIMLDVWNAYESGIQTFIKTYPRELKNTFVKQLLEFNDFKKLPEERKEHMLKGKGYSIVYAFSKKVSLSIFNYDGIPFPEHVTGVLLRFAGVFEQAYIRFLDLQKAEAQAREAQIEAALERVRSRSMAMHKSEELPEVIQLVFEQLRQLNFNIDSAQFDLNFRESDDINLWTAVPGQPYPTQQHIPYFNNAVFNSVKHAKEAGLSLSVHNFTFEEKNEFFNYFFKHTNIPEERRKFILSLPGWARSVVYLDRIYLGIQNYSGIPYSDTEHVILGRFAKVFEQAYTRFLDLQKAEAQAREAQIEAALERVRAQAMAMHNSEDMGQCIVKMFSELTGLGVDERTRFGIGILNHDNEDIQLWTARKDGGEVKMHIGHLNTSWHPLTISARKAWKEKAALHEYVLEAEDLVNYYQMINHAPDYKLQVAIEKLPEREIHYGFIFNHGFFYAFTPREFQPELIQITQRFSALFEQTYRRYLDLERAEAQAREAQIEAALEKVRSRSLAMHNSSELNEVVKVLFEKLTELQVPSTAVGIQTFIEGSNDMQAFVCGDVGTGIVINQYRLPYFDHPIVHDYLHAHKNKLDVFVGNYSKKVKDSFYDVIVKLPELKDLAAEVKTMIYNSDFYEVTIVPAEKSLIAVNDFQGNPLAESQVNILKRFAKVFDQTYTRFLDLQKAEAQAREANIEAALERVRAQAMAMHHTEDLSKTIQVYFEQLDDLIDSAIVRCGAGLLNKENTIAEMSTASKSPEGETYGVKGRIDMRGHPLLESTYEHWLEQKEYHHVLRGNEIREYYQYITGQVAIPENRGEDELHFYFPMFTEGSFYVVTSTEVPENELQIFRRFSSVLSLTYRRFNDLQKAEAQAKEAVKQSSLDRIRGEIASMRTPQDLDRITPLIWKELTALNIPFIRCGVFIMDHALQQIHTFLSTPDGKAIAAFHLPYDSQGRTREILTSWNNKQAYIEHWDETAFSELGDLLVQQGALPSKDIYLKTVPGGGLYLHCLPFMQGMLYVGNTVKLNEVEIQLIQSVADAFSTAYARYEDFNKLEAAKATVEKTLTDLKQTQAQLVQSEKMASLGELTAGIAHEIQNPLNFVNNFSEVSHELLDEMKAEIDKGNYEEVKAISRDVMQNLEKILHHGKRADGIVKGMLQHSRSSSGTKEPTDINALADEYLRLAYHGLRAKDKSFNAKFETHFDESIEKVEMVPQDIGRVILNLITNAFYAVNERLRQAQPASGYEPTVTVSTKKEGNKVLISVKDNGNGIPDSIKEKIFQPFFTTKPTGQGTGLGLSLSYDVVKAHGGELNVETKENEGSAFIILLPVV